MFHQQYRQCVMMLIIIYLKIYQISSFNTKNNSREQNEVLQVEVRGKDSLGTEESLVEDYFEVNNTASGRTEVKLLKGNTSLITNYNSSTYQLKQYKRRILKEKVVDVNEKEDLLSSKDKLITFEGTQYSLPSPTENPYAVIILPYIDGQNVRACAGTLVTDEWILTAAHCILGETGLAQKILVYAGINSLAEVTENTVPSGSQKRETTTFYPYPAFSMVNKTVDIGVIKVEPKFNLTETVNVMNYSVDPWPYKESHECVLTGFGRVHLKESDTRKTQTLPVEKPCVCLSRLQKLLGAGSEKGYVCSIPKEAYGGCAGDLGGGLICDGKVRAIAVNVLTNVDKKYCGDMSMNLEFCGKTVVMNRFEEVCSHTTWVNSYIQLYDDKAIHPDCTNATDKKPENEGSNKTKLSFGVTILLTIGLLNI